MINIENIDTPSWSQNICDYPVNDTLLKVFDKHNISQNNETPNMVIPCTYNNIDFEIADMRLLNNQQRFFIVNNADYFIGKDYIWNYLSAYYGNTIASTLMPKTYVLNNDYDISELKMNFKNLYILKKNIQRQEGLKITNNLDEVLLNRADYVIAQEMLQDPYIINGRKINMRFYVLVICKQRNVDVYVYGNGFMYYTPKLFKLNSLDFDENITTGYIDRSVYDENPLTHIDFINYLDNQYRELSTTEINLKTNSKLSDYLFSKIHKLLHDIFIPFSSKICGGKMINNVAFQLFGADIAVNDKLEPMLMEINKGPDMGAKDERDGIIKFNCIEDMLNIIGIAKLDRKNDFKLILET